MSVGTGNLPYPGKSYTPFDILTAEELNEDVANIESLAAGTGIGDGAIASHNIDFATLNFGNYSLAEKDTGFTWVDGRTIYKKTINTGALPNSTNKNIAHGISGLSNIISMDGFAYSSTTNVTFPLPTVNTGPTFAVGLQADKTNIRLQTGVDYSSYNSSYVTLSYTKT